MKLIVFMLMMKIMFVIRIMLVMLLNSVCGRCVVNGINRLVFSNKV